MSRRQFFRNAFRRERGQIESGRINIDKNRGRPHPRDAAGGGKEGISRRNHGVVRPEAKREENIEQGIGAGRNADGVFHPAIISKRPLKFFHLWTENELLGAQNVIDLPADGIVEQPGIVRSGRATGRAWPTEA